jgi:rSAM/selenodomain-associated transferase 1
VDAKRLIIFVKAPRPGAVKTRLARELGADAACAAYRQMVEQLIARLMGLDRVELRFTPDDAGDQVKAWQRPGWQLVPQGEGDLGQRLQRAFADAFALFPIPVLVIGSDCPTLTQADIELAWDALRENDAVLGPAQDGGYWLIGLREPQPNLFETIAWSTPEVLQQTLQKIEIAGLKAKLLQVRRDIDSAADWSEFLQGKGA